MDCALFFFFQAEDGIRDDLVTRVQTCALPILIPNISKDPPTHGGVYFDHLEQFGISFQTFEKIPRNAQCFPDCVILGEASLQ